MSTTNWSLYAQKWAVPTDDEQRQYYDSATSVLRQPPQPSLDRATTSNIYAAIRLLQKDIAEIKQFISETPELLKDVVEQMHSVLSALDDIEAATRS